MFVLVQCAWLNNTLKLLWAESDPMYVLNVHFVCIWFWSWQDNPLPAALCEALFQQQWKKIASSNESAHVYRHNKSAFRVFGWAITLRATILFSDNIYSSSFLLGFCKFCKSLIYFPKHAWKHFCALSILPLRSNLDPIGCSPAWGLDAQRHSAREQRNMRSCAASHS